MGTRLVDVSACFPRDARPIGRARAVVAAAAVAPALAAAAARAQAAPAAAPVPPEPMLTLAEADKRVAQAVLEAGKKAADKAAQKAYQEGFDAGAKSVTSAQGQWLEKVGAGMELALKQLEQQWLELEHLSLDIASLTLERVLGKDEDRAQLLQQIVHQQMEQLSEATVLRLRLSEVDTRRFPDLLGTLQERYDGRMTVCADSQLASGACVFELQLGQLDASIATQLELIRALISDAVPSHVSA